MLHSLRFLKEFCLHPSQTGALAPSGRRLAKGVVQALGPLEPQELVVELGPGTGAFTRALRAQLPDNPVIAIERNERFVIGLRKRFPDVVIAEGCASEIRKNLRQHHLEDHRIGGVISGLPLLSLPKPLVRNIFASLSDILPAGATFINFTYSKRTFRRIETPGFEVVESRRVLLNVPPASIMILRQLG